MHKDTEKGHEGCKWGVWKEWEGGHRAERNWKYCPLLSYIGGTVNCFPSKRKYLCLHTPPHMPSGHLLWTGAGGGTEAADRPFNGDLMTSQGEWVKGAEPQAEARGQPGDSRSCVLGDSLVRRRWELPLDFCNKEVLGDLGTWLHPVSVAV